MAKIKLSLPSGSEVEKPVISYFSNGGNYLILDGESVGSMGLPIILVSKVNGNKAEKIVDQNEWQQVKGYLKSIISGSPTTYLATPDAIPADETYYTQLTLPVASFDSLKKSYVVPAADASSPATPDSAPAPVNPSPEAAVTTPVEASPAPVDAATDIPAAPVSPDPAEPVPVTDTPGVADNSASGDMQPVNMSTEIAPEAPVLNVPTPETPIVDTSVTPDVNPAVASPIAGEEPIANEALSASESTPAPVEEVPVAETPIVAEPVVDTAPLPDPATTEVPTIDPVISDPVVSEPVVETDLPAVDGVETPQDNMDINAIKQKFMHACEELFESLAALTKK